MPGAFLYQDRVAGGAVTSPQASVGSMPAANLQDAQPRRRARLMGNSASIVADLGAPVPVDCAALISTTLGSGATIRVRLANVANFSVTLADTGLLNAESQDEGQGNVVVVFPAPVTARYLRVDLTDGAAAYMDIGRLVAGELWRTTRSIAYGIEEGRDILDRRDRNPYTGAEFPVPAIINPRFARFTLPVLSDAEVKNQHRALVRLLGAAKDGLVIPDLADALAERNRRALYGAMNTPGGSAGTIMRGFDFSERSFIITERV